MLWLFPSQVFDAYREAEFKQLVMFSDAVHTVGGFRFGGKGMSKADIETVVTQLRRQQRLPDLRGVKVWWVGAGKPRHSLSPQQTMWIRSFWFAYLNEAGARIRTGDYGSRLLGWTK